ncbi:hypothetical protein HMPREF9943_01663 [Eggerthia catenaformis OT 569 = DSM 20559]|uniref:Uncharacterized protein n=1 Tax=Eggerthia catenaformis OT 569 = DSM 20559 TaxID=999415 RepID=M2Q000_9FIRM|nr:hypothetical protein [Eggerthia catenaformis]EMD16260.1 hypothetical protein HMPREF9943_01663 [Eggerthia catenaformis OT 569 = DSM 20559]
MMIYTLHVSVHNFAVLLDYSDLSEANQSSVYISQLSQRKRPKKLSKEEKDILSLSYLDKITELQTELHESKLNPPIIYVPEEFTDSSEPEIYDERNYQ